MVSFQPVDWYGNKFALLDALDGLVLANPKADDPLNAGPYKSLRLDLESEFANQTLCLSNRYLV